MITSGAFSERMTRNRRTPLIDLVAGARPNFIKLAPVHRAIIAAGKLTPRIVHTGLFLSLAHLTANT